MSVKKCAFRKSKENPDVYVRVELEKIARKKGIPEKDTKNLKKKQLCELLGIKWIAPQSSRVPGKKKALGKKKAPKSQSLDGRPCTVQKSKLHPDAYSKEELVLLAIKRLGYTEREAKKLKKNELCKFLNDVKKPLPKKPLAKKAEKDKCCIEKSRLKLKPHQRDIVNYLRENRGAVAVHSVGSGKTLTAVTASQCFLAEHPNWKVIVVTPTSLQDNFKKEIEAYGADPKDPRYEFYTLGKFANTYSRKLCPSNVFLIIDEAHNLRTDIKAAETSARKRAKKGKKPGVPKAKVAVECAKRVNKILLLTATPIYNNPMDIVNLAAIVKGEEYMSKNQFKKIYDQPELFNEYFECIFSFYDRPKSEFYPTVNEHTIRIIMSPEYYKKYRDIEKKEMYLMNEIDPWVFLNGVRQATNALEPCQKCQWAVDKILEGQKTVLFSSFKTYGVRKIQEMLEGTGIDYAEVSGGMNIKNRKKSVDEFNASDGPNVLFITKAGGEGLDLKGVRNVIHLEGGWNRAGEDQVNGRAARFKSHHHLKPKERNVNVYYLKIIKPVIGKDPDDKRIGSADEILEDLVINKGQKNFEVEEMLRAISIEKCLDR